MRTSAATTRLVCSTSASWHNSRDRTFSWRGGRAVECAGLENRKAERPREFESHPLRSEPDWPFRLAGRAIKVTTGRARPSVKSEQAWNGPRLSSKYHAFPSGHVFASTAFFGVLTFASWPIGLPCLLIPILIGVSRIYGGAHYLSDVVCAAVLGMLCAILVARFFLKIGNQQSAIEN